MGRPSRFTLMKIKKAEIVQVLKNESQDFFTHTELWEILDSYKDQWELPRKTTVNDFIKFLNTEEIITYYELQFPHKTIHRYVFKEVSIFKLSSSLLKGSYLSHHAAAVFHNLTATDIGEVYINKEQSDKGNTTNQLSQANINKAFSNKMRRSNNFAIINGTRIVVLNGKYTGDLGVETDMSTNIRVSSIARTLIDIAVRPLYCGGPENVLKIYEQAKGKFSVKELSLLLEKLNYGYPYHQSIGFYLDRSNYPVEDISIFRNMDRLYDFYLSYKMDNPSYDKDWKIYFPNSLS